MHTFSQKQWCGTFLKKSCFDINQLNNVSLYLFPNIWSVLTDNVNNHQMATLGLNESFQFSHFCSVVLEIALLFC
jgi:hypothetical protein